MSDTAKPFAEVPRLGVLRVLRVLANTGGGRVDMLSNLCAQYDELGPVVAQIGGPFRFVNLFGPDANRMVLLDRDQIFSARQPWMQIMGRIFPNGLLLRDGSRAQAPPQDHARGVHAAGAARVRRAHGPTDRDRHRRLGRERRAAIRAFRAFKGLTLDLAAVDLRRRRSRARDDAA